MEEEKYLDDKDDEIDEDEIGLEEEETNEEDKGIW